MHLQAMALLCSALPHAENGIILRALSAEHGLIAAYVPGGRSRRLRGALQPGNLLSLALTLRAEGQLASATVELADARAPLATSRAALAVLEWAMALTASALPERLPHPALYPALDALVMACAADAPSSMLGDTLIRYELLLLAELGFGLDLTSCAATGVRTDLAYVSPRSARAVSRDAGAPWASRLLPLPGFLLGHAVATPAGLRDGLALTGHFLARHILTGHHTRLLDSRPRLAKALGAAPDATPMDEPPAAS